MIIINGFATCLLIVHSLSQNGIKAVSIFLAGAQILMGLRHIQDVKPAHF